MDVYLVPLGPDHYELYCEVPDDAPDEDEEPRAGFSGRLKARFREMLAEAERNRRQGGTAGEIGGWAARVKARVLRWIAESIAEQRLLWHLRRQTEACLFYPDDLDEPAARGIMRAQLGRDFDKHRFWLAIDSIAFVASGALMLVPGPNVVAYYFAFRLVGHYLSLRGAKQGLGRVEWTAERSAPLGELRQAIGLDRLRREQQVRDVALRLRLEHLATFFERTAVSSS